METPIVSFGERYLNQSTPPPISHRDVKRLAMEGGGGKGNAYLGALFALDQLGVLRQLDTVAGSSAGAITALALSLGMRPTDVFAFMNNTDFAEFFDKPSAASPTPGGPYKDQKKGQKYSLQWAKAEMASKNIITVGGYIAPVIGAMRMSVGQLLEEKVILPARQASSKILQELLQQLYRVEDVAFALGGLQIDRGANRPPLRPPTSPAPVPLIVKLLAQLLDFNSLPKYLASLSLDMGVFSGEAARDRLAALIAERMAIVDPAAPASRSGPVVDGRAVTFAQLDSFSSVHGYPRLRVTGSDMCALRTVIFSGRTTPNFPVADAVRISMGLPFVYKPYSIKSTGSGLPPCGVYVDGGVFSNLPLLAFSDEEATKAVGLRLEIDIATRIDGFLGLLPQIAKASLLAGESSVTTDRANRSVRLDTEPLGLFDFTSDPDTLAKVAARSHLTTMLFFGQGSDYKPVDFKTGQPPEKDAEAAREATWQDLRASIARRRMAGGCVFDPEYLTSHE